MLRSNEDIRQCGCCGFSVPNSVHKYYDFQEVKSIYKVGYDYICGDCVDVANKFINYYGVKKQKDLDKLHRYLIGGILPMKQYSMLINAGYY